MASGSRHRSPKPKPEMVDFSSLVWPPPELRPPPTPDNTSTGADAPILVHAANNTQYYVQPGQSLSEARRLAGVRRTGRAGTASSSCPTEVGDERENQPPIPCPEHSLPRRFAGGTRWRSYTASTISSYTEDVDSQESSTGSDFLPTKSRVPTPHPVYDQLHGNPSNSIASQATGSGKGQFGCKDFPVGYAPTPRPLSPPPHHDRAFPSSRSQPQHPHRPKTTHTVPIYPNFTPDPVHTSSSSYHPQPYRPKSAHSNPMPFFEPAGPIPNPHPAFQQEDFVLPVIENGRYVSHCRVSGKSGLSPKGYIERPESSPIPTLRDTPASGLFKSRGPPATNLLGLDGTGAGAGSRPRASEGFTPSPLTYDDMPVYTSSSSREDEYYYPVYPDSDPRSKNPPLLRRSPDYQLPPPLYIRERRERTREPIPFASRSTSASTSRASREAERERAYYDGAMEEMEDLRPIMPTRMGFWNQRGDTLNAMGQLVTAPHERCFPPDLAQYPRFALMDENRRVVLPENTQDRMTLWRRAQFIPT